MELLNPINVLLERISDKLNIIRNKLIKTQTLSEAQKNGLTAATKAITNVQRQINALPADIGTGGGGHSIRP